MYPTVKHSRSAALAALLFLALLSAGCDGGLPPEIRFTGNTMGTTYTVKVVGEGLDAESLEGCIADTLEAVNAKMSTWRDDSELSRFNQSEETTPFPLSDETLGVFAIALEVSRLTDGAFDVTVGPLVNAWGFGPGEGDPPDNADIARLKKDVGYGLLTFDRDHGTLAKARPGVYCDLSAVAKGYGVDAVAQALQAEGVTRYMVEVGGEVRTAGLNQRGEPWRIGIYRPDPDRFDLQRVVPLSGRSMATSGDYRNFLDVDGKRISHTIDPRTGRPVEHGVASVSVVHESCAWADAWATALMVLPPDEGHALAVAQDLAVYLIIHDGDQAFVERTTPAFDAL